MNSTQSGDYMHRYTFSDPVYLKVIMEWKKKFFPQTMLFVSSVTWSKLSERVELGSIASEWSSGS